MFQGSLNVSEDEVTITFLCRHLSPLYLFFTSSVSFLLILDPNIERYWLEFLEIQSKKALPWSHGGKKENNKENKRALYKKVINVHSLIFSCDSSKIMNMLSSLKQS